MEFGTGLTDTPPPPSLTNTKQNNTMIDKAVREFLNSLNKNAQAVRLAEPAWLKSQREKNFLLAQKIEWEASCQDETEAQRKIRVFNEWEDILAE